MVDMSDDEMLKLGAINALNYDLSDTKINFKRETVGKQIQLIAISALGNTVKIRAIVLGGFAYYEVQIIVGKRPAISYVTQIYNGDSREYILDLITGESEIEKNLMCRRDKNIRRAEDRRERVRQRKLALTMQAACSLTKLASTAKLASPTN